MEKSPEENRRGIFSRSRYAESRIVPREPRVPQFDDESIQQFLMLPSQPVAVLHLLRIPKLAKERVKYGEPLFHPHRLFPPEAAHDRHFLSNIVCPVPLRQRF